MEPQTVQHGADGIEISNDVACKELRQRNRGGIPFSTHVPVLEARNGTGQFPVARIDASGGKEFDDGCASTCERQVDETCAVSAHDDRSLSKRRDLLGNGQLFGLNHLESTGTQKRDELPLVVHWPVVRATTSVHVDRATFNSVDGSCEKALSQKGDGPR